MAPATNGAQRENGAVRTGQTPRADKVFQPPFKVRTLDGSVTVYLDEPHARDASAAPLNGKQVRAAVESITGRTVLALYRQRGVENEEHGATDIPDDAVDLPPVMYVQLAPETASSDSGKQERR